MASEEVEILSDCASDRSSEDSEEISGTEAFGESSTLSGKFHSDVWRYFTRSTNGKKALCQLCNKEYASHETTSNLRYHLQIIILRININQKWFPMELLGFLRISCKIVRAKKVNKMMPTFPLPYISLLTPGS